MLEELTLDDQTLGTLHELRETMTRRVVELRAEAGLLAGDFEDWQRSAVPDPPSVDARRHIPAYKVLRERVDISLELLELAEELEQVNAAIARRPRPEPDLRAAPPMLRPRPPTRSRVSPDSRKVVAGIAITLVLLTLALVAVVMTEPPDEGSVDLAPPAQVVATPIHWRDVSTVPAASNGPCIWRPALGIAEGAPLRGQTAVVMLSGPDFATQPTREAQVNKNGVVTFRVDLKNCSRIARDEASLVSVDGNMNVHPAPHS